MNITVRDHNKIVVIAIAGEFFAEHVKQINEVWRVQIEKKPDVIVIDCQELMYIDSTAIGTLVNFHNTAADKDIKLIFSELNNTIIQIFETAGLDSFFTIITQREFESKYLHDS
jgi:anti-sigma B factor antagonist